MKNLMVVVTCPLCGYKYDRTMAECSGCPMARNCHVLCCPHCGYQTVDDTHIRDMLTKIRSFIVWVKHRILKMKF